jgi:hypothetical protein
MPCCIVDKTHEIQRNLLLSLAGFSTPFLYAVDSCKTSVTITKLHVTIREDGNFQTYPHGSLKYHLLYAQYFFHNILWKRIPDFRYQFLLIFKVTCKTYGGKRRSLNTKTNKHHIRSYKYQRATFQQASNICWWSQICFPSHSSSTDRRFWTLRI